MGLVASFDDRSPLLWDVVLGDASWSEALEAISATAAGATVFLLQGVVRLSLEYWSCNFDEESKTCGLSDPADLFDLPRNSFAGPMNRAPVGIAFDRRELISDTDYERDATMGHLRDRGVFQGMLSKLVGSGRFAWRPKNRADDCVEAADAFTAWIGPLQRELRAHYDWSHTLADAIPLPP